MYGGLTYAPRAASGPFRVHCAFSMVSLKLQKRLAASVLGCGLRKVRARMLACATSLDVPASAQVWLDPNEVNEISIANSSE